MNTIKRILDVLHCKLEDVLKSWASYLPANGEKKSNFGEQLNGVTVLLRTKYKNYMQAIIIKLASNVSNYYYLVCNLAIFLRQSKNHVIANVMKMRFILF